MLRKIKRRIARRWDQILNRFSKKRRCSLARDGVDAKLAKFLPEQGFFVEAGGYDGKTSSTTYYLEMVKGWQGILVEPDPEMYELCKSNRPNAKVYNAALVSSDYKGDTIELTVLGDDRSMSFVSGGEVCDKARELTTSSSNRIEARAVTLNQVLNEVGVSHVDFFSLDVEGCEGIVLDGIDLEKITIEFLLVECLSDDALDFITRKLAKTHEFVSGVSSRDYLFRAV